MKTTSGFAQCSIDELKELLAGGTLNVYSVARPLTANKPVDRSGLLATFTFASPAFGPSTEDGQTPLFVANPVAANTVGTPGFARAFRADGTAVADFSAGPGDREIKFREVSCSHGAPIAVTQFKFKTEDNWPEKPEYYDTHPRSGYPMPRNP